MFKNAYCGHCFAIGPSVASVPAGLNRSASGSQCVLRFCILLRFRPRDRFEFLACLSQARSGSALQPYAGLVDVLRPANALRKTAANLPLRMDVTLLSRAQEPLPRSRKIYRLPVSAGSKNTQGELRGGIATGGCLAE